MKSYKELLFEKEQKAVDRKIAKALGISLKELMQFEWEILTDKSDDGDFYALRVRFSESNDLTKLKKLLNVDHDLCCYIPYII